VLLLDRTRYDSGCVEVLVDCRYVTAADLPVPDYPLGADAFSCSDSELHQMAHLYASGESLWDA
jgi:hypothetical protein